MANPFKIIDNFLQVCEDYFDFRIKTGQAVGDVKVLSGESEQYTQRETKIYFHRIRRPILAFIRPIWSKLVLIPLVQDIADLIVDTYNLMTSNYTALFIILSVSFPSFILLYNLFIKSPVPFFIWLLPIILYTTICFSALYSYMYKKSKGEKSSLISNFFSALRSFPTTAILILTHMFTIFIFINLFLVFTFFLSYFYDLIGYDWTNSFSYWYLAIFSFLLALFTIFIFNIVFYQAYFFTILEKNNLSLSLSKAWALVKNYYFKFIFLGLIFTILFFYIIYSATIAYFPGGLIVSLFCFYSGTIFFHFVLRRKFNKDVVVATDSKQRNIPLIIGILIFGFATYILASIVAARQHQTIINLVDTIQEQSYIAQQLQTYTNKEEGYTIEYPKPWSLYEEKDNTITFYNNYTNSHVGGIFLTIKISPFAESNFYQLYNIRPGLAKYDTLNKDVTFKTYNFSIQKYEGVKYTYYKADPPNDTIYETHYLVHKGDKQYDIAFKTFDKNVEGDNLRLFDRISESFKFNEK